MFGMIKIAGLSAVLSAGLVSAYNPAPAPEGKLYYDRVAQSDDSAGGPMLRTVAYSTHQGAKASPRNCAEQAWPNITPECLHAAEGTPARAVVRTITIEKRDGGNVSTLVRLPADVAPR